MLGDPEWLVQINRWNRIVPISTDVCIVFHLCYLATTQVEAKLCAVEQDTFEVYLYATIENEKVSERIVF